MEFYINAGEYKQAEKLGVMNCIECGSCAYNCPAKRALTQSFSFAKGKIREINAKETAK
jgi:electron transport complex protein RnfC